MHLFGIEDKEMHDKYLGYWSNVYGL